MFVGSGWVSPSEFWGMTPKELWWLYEMKVPPEQRINAVDDFDAAYERLMNG